MPYIDQITKISHTCTPIPELPSNISTMALIVMKTEKKIWRKRERIKKELFWGPKIKSYERGKLGKIDEHTECKPKI